MQPSFYGRVMTHAYDIGENPPEIIALYLALWEQYGRPQPALEPMCGTGLNLIPFLQAGAECDGMDNSPFMLERCRVHLVDANLSCTLYEQDITTCHVERRYRFIFIPGGSFGLITDTSHALAALQQLIQALEPGGWLVFDVRTPAQLNTFGSHGQIDHTIQSYPDGSTVFSTGLWEHVDGGAIIRQWVKLEHFVGSTLQATEAFDYQERLYTPEAICELVTRAGLHNITTTKAYTLNAKLSADDGIVVSCQK